MPKLNVQQNNQNVIQAFKNALAIGNLKGIIASDGSHNFSTAGSNRNLLDNPFFTVNQRSFTTGTNGSYFADRWKLSNTDLITATRNSDGTITFTKTSGGTPTFIQHYIDRQTGLDEEATYTASLMDGDGNVYSVTEKFVPGTQSEKPVFINGLRVAIGLYGKGGQIWMGLYLQPESSGTFTLKAAKLELGSVSTLANDAPPNYAEELAKCKYYFRRITNIGRGRLFIGIGFSGGVEVPNIFGVGNEMRKTTSLAVTYSGSFVVSAGTDIAVTSISRNENNSNFGLSFSASGITPYSLYSILGSAGAYIDISADL